MHYTVPPDSSTHGLPLYSVMSGRHPPRKAASFANEIAHQLHGPEVPYSPKHMAHCLLSYKEAREYERDGRIPDCRNHHHLPAKKAEEMEANGTHRWVGGNEARHCRIVPCEAKEWAKASSSGFQVMQMRKVFRTKPAPARRYGYECGKQPRPSATMARDVNCG